MSAAETLDVNGGSVVSMRGFLHDVLDNALEIDRQLHTSIHGLRERIHALDLAEDPEFRQRVQTLSERIDADPTVGDPGLTSEEFAAKYLVR
jgi:hypothetical protein